MTGELWLLWEVAAVGMEVEAMCMSMWEEGTKELWGSVLTQKTRSGELANLKCGL